MVLMHQLPIGMPLASRSLEGTETKSSADSEVQDLLVINMAGECLARFSAEEALSMASTKNLLATLAERTPLPPQARRRLLVGETVLDQDALLPQPCSATGHGFGKDLIIAALVEWSPAGKYLYVHRQHDGHFEGTLTLQHDHTVTFDGVIIGIFGMYSSYHCSGIWESSPTYQGQVMITFQSWQSDVCAVEEFSGNGEWPAENLLIIQFTMDDKVLVQSGVNSWASMAPAIGRIWEVCGKDGITFKRCI